MFYRCAKSSQKFWISLLWMSFFSVNFLHFFLLRLKPMKMLTCTQNYPHFNWHSVQLKHSWNHFETVKNQGPFCGFKSAAQNTTQMNWWQHTSTWSLSVLSLLIHLNMIIISHPPQNTVSLTEMWHERWPIINWEEARKSRRSRTKTHNDTQAFNLYTRGSS